MSTSNPPQRKGRFRHFCYVSIEGVAERKGRVIGSSGNFGGGFTVDSSGFILTFKETDTIFDLLSAAEVALGLQTGVAEEMYKYKDPGYMIEGVDDIVDGESLIVRTMQ